MALVNGGSLHCMNMKKLLKKTSPKPLVRFRNNFTEYSLGDPFLNTVHEILICQ